MGLFDKKYCSICGGKIGLLGNRKLEDGDMCKDCAGKLSPFFNERRHSSVEAIKRQLIYREENKMQLSSFCPNMTFGDSRKVYIDTVSGRFIVTSYSNWRNANPDLIYLSQVRNINTDIHENKKEIYYKDEEGKNQSYSPRRYEYNYAFNVTIFVDSPWFDEIKLELSDGNRPESPHSELYQKYERKMYELRDVLMGRITQPQVGYGQLNQGYVQPVQNNYTQPLNNLGVGNMVGNVVSGVVGNMVGNNLETWFCPSCGAQNNGAFCQNCGSGKPTAAGNNQCWCVNCGWKPALGQQIPKFCPQCGNQLY